MAEPANFGPGCVRIPGAILMVSGPVLTITDARGHEWLFEFQNRPGGGPFALHRKTHDPLQKQPGPRSPFWTAVELWRKQGFLVENGRALWHPEPPPRMVHLAGPATTAMGAAPLPTATTSRSATRAVARGSTTPAVASSPVSTRS